MSLRLSKLALWEQIKISLSLSFIPSTEKEVNARKSWILISGQKDLSKAKSRRSRHKQEDKKLGLYSF